MCVPGEEIPDVTPFCDCASEGEEKTIIEVNSATPAAIDRVHIAIDLACP